jgi:hypothetical protein
MGKTDRSHTGVTEQIQSNARLTQVMFARLAAFLYVWWATAFLTLVVLGTISRWRVQHREKRTVITGFPALAISYGKSAKILASRRAGRLKADLVEILIAKLLVIAVAFERYALGAYLFERQAQ